MAGFMHPNALQGLLHLLPGGVSFCVLPFESLAAQLMSSLYEEHRDEDGFLYITYSGENTFGGELLTDM
jgi:hypothetical protein